MRQEEFFQATNKMDFIDYGQMFEGKNIAVIGGLGSIGSQIIKELVKFNPKRIIVLDNRETEAMYSMHYPISSKIHTELIDVRDYDSVEKSLKGVDLVFHAAALKHVVVCEDNPFEAVKTNVIGTKNVIEACLKNNVKKMILISTDKAVNPTNVMGATKLLAEKLVGAVATSEKLRENPTTKFGIVRFGNVLYSRGSVLEIWNRQLKEKNEITLTDENMTRFFMATSDCVNLIFNVTKLAREGEIFVLKMPTIKIGDLARAYAEIKNLPVGNIKVIGARKGEKKHEELLLDEDGNITLENENLFVKFPAFASEENILNMKMLGFKEQETRHFSSDKSILLNLEQIKEVLSKEKELL